MKIVQLLSHLNIGDAIGNDVLVIHETLKKAGYYSVIMALTIHDKLKDVAIPADFSLIDKDDILLFHKANGDPFLSAVSSAVCYKVLIYHNITPASFFWSYDPVMAWNQIRGRKQLRKILPSMDEVWGDSAYNCKEIRNYGYSQEKTSVLPILLNLKFGDAHPSGKKKIVFLGRIAPNKKQEDLIKAFYCYLEYDPQAQLILIGSWDGFEKYYAKLRGFMADLELTEDQVVFTGRVTDAEKESWLSEASLFLCMSEHEGFCIPVLEAMAYNIPVMAYRSCAVPETVGENGLLFDRKDYANIAKEMDHVISDPFFRESVLERQNINLKRFDLKRSEELILELIDRIRGKTT